jgi:hypothetical protein
MAAFLTRGVRLLKLTADEAKAAERVLGPDHPLARALSFQHTLAIQSLVASIAVLLAVAGVVWRIDLAPVAVAAACSVALALGVAVLCTRQVTRDRAQTLIAKGDDGIVLQVVRKERRRLATLKVREELARSLEHLLRDAQLWHRMTPLSRPLPGVRCLRHAASEVVDVTAALRAEHVRVRGVALTARLLIDGHASPLYAGEPDLLREELNRIRFLLGAQNPSFETDTATRAAA